MTKDGYLELYRRVVEAGYGLEIEWQESLKPCEDAYEFKQQYIWVVISSGIKNQVARLIEKRIYAAIDNGEALSGAFHHATKVRAIDYMREHYRELFGQYQAAEDKLVFLETLQHIGPVTKYHLAKNLGLDCVKPDRHLVRIAQRYKTTPEALCRRLALQVGQRVSTVDLVIWRAANLGYA